MFQPKPSSTNAFDDDAFAAPQRDHVAVVGSAAERDGRAAQHATPADADVRRVLGEHGAVDFSSGREMEGLAATQADKTRFVYPRPELDKSGHRAAAKRNGGGG